MPDGEPGAGDAGRVRAMFGALDGGDVEAALRWWHEDCVDHAAVAGSPPGRAGVRASMEFVLAAFPGARFRPVRVVADRSGVACLLVVEGRQAGPIYGVPATGRHAAWRHFHLFRFADGLIVEHDAVRDDRGLVRHLTRDAPPPAG